MGLTATAAATAVAACTTSGGGSRRAAGHIVVANHPVYIDAATNPSFTAATGTIVEYHEEIADDDEWLGAVEPRLARGERIDRDVAIVSDWAADRLARNAWSVEQAPWAEGMVGIAYDRRAVGGDVHTLAELFRPPLRGRVALPTDLRIALGMALLADHVDPATVTLDQATTTAARLANSVRLGQVLAFDGSAPVDHLLSGAAAAVVVRASDTVGLEAEHPDIVFVTPDEGGLVLTDVAVVPVGGANPAGATAYLQFVNDPAHAADRFSVIPAVVPARPSVQDRLRTTAPAVLADPRRNPAPEMRARLHRFRFLTDDEERRFRTLFAGVVDPTR